MPPKPPMTPERRRAAEDMILKRYEDQGLYNKSLFKKASEAYDALQKPGDASRWLVTWEGEYDEWPQERPTGHYATVMFSTIQHLLWRNVHCLHDLEGQALIWKEYIPTPPLPILYLNLTEAAQKFDEDSIDWLNGRYHADLCEALHHRGIPTVRKIVGFGLGGFFFQQQEIGNKRSMMQHRLVKSLRDILRNHQETTSIQVLVQDPRYGRLEKDILDMVVIHAVDHPFQGFLEVDEQTAVVSIAPQIPVKQIITDISRPALIIWDAVSPRFEDSTGPENER